MVAAADDDDGDQEDDGGDVVVDGQDKPRQCVSQIDTNPLTLRKKIKAIQLEKYCHFNLIYYFSIWSMFLGHKFEFRPHDNDYNSCTPCWSSSSNHNWKSYKVFTKF